MKALQKLLLVAAVALLSKTVHAETVYQVVTSCPSVSNVTVLGYLTDSKGSKFQTRGFTNSQGTVTLAHRGVTPGAAVSKVIGKKQINGVLHTGVDQKNFQVQVSCPTQVIHRVILKP